MEPHSKLFGDKNAPIVWAVDDAWYDSYGDDTSLNFKLRASLTKELTLDELQKVIRERQERDISSGDLEYLSILVELCIQHNLRLGLCNFDCFSKKFLLLDQPGSAILLDVHRPGDHASGYPANEYGIYLLQNVLNGARPKADIFWVTGKESSARRLIEKKQYDPKWWPLTGLQIVDKSAERLRDSLSAFIEYFVQGLEKDPFVNLARALIKVRSENNTHPDSLEKLVKRVNGLPLSESFISLEEEEETQGCTSFKSLYHSSDVEEAGMPEEGELAEYPIMSGILAEHFGFLGVDISTEGNRKLYLPIQPGLVFILYFCFFLRELKQNRVTLSFTEKPGIGTEAKLFVPLDSPTSFQAAAYAAEVPGEATRWFKRTLTGRGQWVLKLANQPYRNQHIPWKPPLQISGSRTYPLIVTPTFSDNGLELTWEWPVND